jgi:hypothetical protein
MNFSKGIIMETRDQTLTSLLITNHQEMKGFRKDDRGDVYFHFDDNNRVREIEEGFFRNTASVPVLDFVAAQRQVKGIIFRLKGSNNYGKSIKQTNTDDCAV